MGGLFSKPKGPKMPRVQAIPPVPEVGPEAGDYAAKLARRRRGYAKTILTGPLEPTGKKTVLG